MNSSSIPNVPSLIVGGRVFTDLKNLIVLYFYSTGAAPFCTPRKFAAASGYTPSGAKAFRVWAAEISVNTATWSFEPGYGDTDVGVANSAAPTNSKGVMGNALNTNLVTYSTAAVQAFQLPLDLLVPNGKYVATVLNFSSAVGSGRLFGYEE